MSGEAIPVEARDLVKRYGEIVAVDHVDLTVERGDVFGYLGPNGAGKTTSLRMMLGLIRPTEGSVQLFGRPQSASVRFQVRNAGAATARYRVGEREYELRPRHARTHTTCGPSAAMI